MKATFDHSEQAADNIRTFWFRPEKPVHYTAGQFTELRLPHDDKDKRGDKRWFTLSSSPTDEMLSITTKFATDNGSTFKQTLAALEPGTIVNMASPMGDFVLPKDASIPLIFVAGGIGCTPYHSMTKYLQDSSESRNITILYAASSAGEVVFKDIFNKLGDHFKTLIGERLSVDKILELSGGSQEQYVYLSGPEPMIEALDKDLKNSGFNKKHIRTDFFPGYVEI